MSNNDYYFRALPHLDKKWSKANLTSALHNPEDLAIFWNNLLQDDELSTTRYRSIINSAGHSAYLKGSDKFYCGAATLTCSCCKGVCSEKSACSCQPCQKLETDEAGKKFQHALFQQENDEKMLSSELVFESWLWSPIPSNEQKTACIKSLLAEQHEICLQSAASCLSAVQLKQLMLVYRRYFIALARCKDLDSADANQVLAENALAVEAKAKQQQTVAEKPLKDYEKATMGLARVGTRAALNFSFAFLRRAWKSGEDTELCSELLMEALDALQTLPEGSLFDTSQISSIWMEVVEKSIKFLRQVVGDTMGRVPKPDRHIALSLLLELGTQKGTLAGSLEGILLLLTLWEKDAESVDNRVPLQTSGAPLVPILRRYEKISSNYVYNQTQSDRSLPSSPTESFLRFLSLPDDDTARVDIKQAAVIIISHLDRLAKPHLPIGNYSSKLQHHKSAQQIFTLGWSSLSPEVYGFTAEAITGAGMPGMLPKYSASTIELENGHIVSQVVTSETAIVLLTTQGSVLTINHSSWSTVGAATSFQPKLLDFFGDAGSGNVSIVQVAAHCEGKHFLALTTDGEVYSWGLGEGGRLGHGDHTAKEQPTKIEALTEKSVCRIFCGATYSAAISSSGEIYTWGRGSYGRLGHGTSDDKLVPTLVQALKSHHVVDVALGSGDSHSLCATAAGHVFAWGDGDFGKLGNGSSNGAQIPQQIEGLEKIVNVYSGSQFSVALSSDGVVYSWGKGHGGRLGHGSFDHVSVPKVVQALEGKQICQISVGSAHCLALTVNGELYGWGRNDYHQICPVSINRDPIISVPILTTPPSLRIAGVTCGLALSIAWCNSSSLGISTKIPFVVDLSEHSFRLLDQLLCMVCGAQTDAQRHPPNQEAECIVVACLNLLRLQLHAIIANNLSARQVGLCEGSRLLASLKSRVLSLAGGPTVLKTMQEAAQWTLQVGWSVLLPTASERAQTLTALLPTGHESNGNPATNNCTSGYRFMTDLLVGSLMAEGGLQTALNQAINAEPQDVNSEHHLPLLHLLKQLLRNNSSLSQARLSQLLLGPYIKTEDDFNSSPEPPSPSLDLLHKFQRLLLSHIHETPTTEDLTGAETLLATYLQHFVSFCVITLSKAHEVAVQGKMNVAEVLKSDISDTLLYELLIGLILLQKSKPTILSNFDWNKNFIPLLHGLDVLNRVLCDGEVQDADDMGWPGIISRGVQKPRPQPEEVPLIRKSDLENHILDGGRWIVVNGNVYDIRDYHCDVQAVQDLLQISAGKDLTVELSAPQYRSVMEFISSHLRIGKFVLNETDEKGQGQHALVPLTHFNSERTLAYLLGLRASFLQKATDLQPAEQQCRSILQSQILSGGLQVLQPTNPFDEEKGEARSGCSTAGSTPTEPTNHPPGQETRTMTNWPSTMISQRVESLLYGLGEGRITDPMVSAWIVLTERYCRENRTLFQQEFTAENTVMELERLLMAVLIRHQSLGPLVLAVIDRELSGSDNNKLPEPIIEIIKIVQNTKLSVIKMRQQLNRSYKEVCGPMLDKCRFLLYEIRPAVSLEQLGLKRLLILHKFPRFKTLVRKIIGEMRVSARREMQCAKPEDYLNVTIQSQQAAAMRIQSQENLLKYLSNENLVKHFSIENLTKVASMENLHTRSSSPGELLQNKHISSENLLDVGVVVGLVDTNNQSEKIMSSQDSLAVDAQKTPTNEPVNADVDAKQKNIDISEQFINDVITKLSEKCLLETEVYNMAQKPIVHQIVDFVMQDATCDVETLRRAMFCQVQRYKIRKLGLEMFNDLLKMDGLLDAVQYNLYNGYLGLFVQDKSHHHYMENILANLNMVTAFQKADIILTQSRIIEWGVRELQKYINQEHVHGRQKHHCEKDNSNLGTYVFLKKLPRARFLLSIFGILTKEYDANELSLLINSGMLGSILGLLRQTKGGDSQVMADSEDLSVVYEDVVTRLKSSKEGLTGPELAKLIKLGTRVARGADWKWGDQDGPPPGEGRIISEIGDDGWVRVEWDTCNTNSYRMGKEGRYDLRLADSVAKALSPDRDETKDDLLELQLANESHPTKLLKSCCVKMLQMLATAVGVYGDKMQQSAVLGISSMFRAILNHKTGFVNFGLEQWTTLGFMRATSSSKQLAKYLTSPIWVNLHMEIMEAPIASKKDVYKKLHCIRLLQATLTTWQEGDDRINGIVERIFTILGRICLYCPNDFSLMPADVKSRVLFSASYSGTIAEEIIALLRKLHTLPLWNGVINSFLSQKLCVAAELFSQDYDVGAAGGATPVNDTDRVSIMGSLNVIGGCDSRPRLGLTVTHEGVRGTISGMTKKGQLIVHTFVGDLKKIPIFKINEHSYSSNVFSLSKLTINEVLLNSWAVLMFAGGGAGGDEKQLFQHNQQQNSIETKNLRMQQIQLSVLKATRLLFRHQTLLRKILRQRSPGFARYTSDDSLNCEKVGDGDKPPAEPGKSATTATDGEMKKFDETSRDNELLVQSILLRATQPSPLRACYTFQEMELAALNLSQSLANHVHAETSAPLSRPALPPSQPTLIHGIPIYNNTNHVAAVLDDCTPSSGSKRLPPCPLVAQIVEMGFTRRGVEAAIKSLTTHTEVTPTAEQIVQWILEHPDVNYSALASGAASSSTTSAAHGAAHGSGGHLAAQNHHEPDYNHSDSESISSDTVEGSSLQDGPVKYATRADFQTADQYAMYVRGLIAPQMLVRCCTNFEEIQTGDVGTVLKVEPEGLHDLNVRVDWQMRDRPYWMCFVHLELLSPPPADAQQSATPLPITVGSLVKLRPTYHQHQRFRYGPNSTPRGSVGVVQSISGSEVIVDFPGHSCWLSHINDLESVPQPGGSGQTGQVINYDIIDDWSRCIRSLTVSSNEAQAKYLLTRSSNYWQSASTSQSSSNCKHWIRLEMHDNVLIQSLSITVDPDDCSHMPSLVFVRVGDTMATLKEFNWVSINPVDTNVTLLSDVKQFYPWIEIVVKQCRNNGIQCRIHGLHVIGRRRQTDLDLMLQNAAFLATESDQLCEPSFSMSSSGTSYAEEKHQQASNSTQDVQSKVLVWGLNDKEQLGGLKGSKVKLPTFSSALSSLKPIHIAGGSKSLFIVSQDGKLYACGEGTNGRLGLGHNNNVPTPRQVPVVSQYVVKKVAVHSGGKHALALTLDGKVFSWGEGEDGKLGHGTRLTLEKPKLIETLRNKRIRDIACGSSHSAAISSSGELFTWGLGEYGRLGHGDNTTQLKPKLVAALLGQRVVQVACGSRDAQTLCLTEEGSVFSWGDGDFGKLGRGGSEGCSIPHKIERFNSINPVIQIECGAQFSLALTKSGEIWTWGKGDYYRLGHGSDQHLRKPTPIQGLRGKKVIHVAVGALHSLAVTDSGQVYAWGDNDHGQQGSGNTIVNKKPSLVLGLDGVFVNRVACGSSHSVAWSLPQSPAEGDKKEPVPFAVSKDPLGGHSLGIYASDTEATTSSPSHTVPVKPQRPSLSETLLSLESYGARQAALTYVLKAMNILQARSCVIAALTSHTQLHGKSSTDDEAQRSLSPILEQDAPEAIDEFPQVRDSRPDVIAQGGGEGPADATALANDLVDTDYASLPPSMSSINPYRSLTGSMSLSASLSSCNATQKHSKMSASAMSVVAANMTHQEEIVNESLTGLDDFTSLLGESEARNLIELLKLSVSGRTGASTTVQTIASTLIALGSNSQAIGNMLLETCITELEDLCTSRHCLGKLPKPVMQETSHPYIDDITLLGHVKIPGAEALKLEFDSQCSTEKRNDPLIIMDGSGRVIATRSGREFAQWAPEIRIPGDEMRWKFTSDNSVNGWGFKFYVHAIMPVAYLQEMGSDRLILSQPSMDLVMALLDSTLGPQNTGILLRLVAALAACAQISSLTVNQRIWALKKIHQYLTHKHHAPKPNDPIVAGILSPIIPIILRQYEYEEPQVRSGVHLMHSEYFKTLVALACDMGMDAGLPTGDIHKWAWFRRYCSAIRVAQSLIRRTTLPQTFCLEVRKKLLEMTAPTAAHHLNSTRMSTNSINSSSFVSLSPSTSSSQMNMSGSQYGGSDNGASSLVLPDMMVETNKFMYEDHTYFTSQYDSQLLQWFNRRPEDWAFSWGGASTIFGWGHNHRGQLGGLDGSRIKIPTPCEALSLLRPIQIGGGEQTLYAVTLDGKVYATGYGAGGRLGIGGIDSVSTPTLIESLQHVAIKKVAVNSGGKHALALSADGEVFSWGEGEDGKLGHGNRDSYDRPKLIEALSGIGVLDIACGSAHSACITAQGHVLTWGKGRYGRLGHGDSEDQLTPKLVEALLGYRALDIACGSGDAQTLCITDDDNVFSWGDGDYGKLGRGGSDGCKVPMKIESLAGLGVVKVECGSQFSVALTRSGSVYTWGKGDYHRLGHGNTDHVRRPKKVAALQGKKIISIATGSLHCVACTDQGEVFTWGDNDEGQLGDGTVTAIQRPRLVTALQGKHIVSVICGSAHTLALSTYQLSEAVRPPPSPPLEYDLVRDIDAHILHARLVLLHHFSELICPCLAMLPITGELSMGALKDVLVYGIKETAFRKVIQTTMVRDKPHGPIIELNRIQVKRSRLRSGNGLAGIDGMKSVFGQMVQKLPLLTQEALSMPHRVWKVKFVGESVDDCGGGFSESIAEMCDELQNGCIPLLCITPNGRGEAGANQDCFLLDPTLNSVLHMNMFRFLGVLMGIACRTGSPLSLNLAEPVWRQLSGEALRPTDLTEVDRDFLSGLICIRDMDDDPKFFQSMELPFSTSSARGHEVPLSTRYTKITPANRHEYVKLALNYRLKEFDEQVKAVRDGMSKVIPVPLLSLFSASELMAMVCGSPDIPLGLLKTVATYKGVESTSPLVQWFWEVMEEFSNQERSLFLRFVWGRTRLPRTIADFRGRDFVLQVLDKYNPPDHFLPESYTCFFLLKMPRYSCKAVLLEKLKYAIHFCKSIDTDEYARVAIAEATEATGSEDNSDIESIA